MNIIRPPLSELPLLLALCWQGQRASVDGLSDRELLHCYERGWHYRRQLAEPSPAEWGLIEALVRTYPSWIEADMNNRFNYPEHQQILELLSHLNVQLMQECPIYFAGGTLLSLSYGEYRLSRDIDLLCSYGAAYSRLRQAIYDQGQDALFKAQQELPFQLGELNTNQYGARLWVRFNNGVRIKVEVVAEGRVVLEPAIQPDWSPVPCLSLSDQVAQKLLANSDRWRDTSTDSRDLVDLCILKLRTSFPQMGLDKAEAAFRVVEPLRNAIAMFQEQPEYRLRCYERLSVRDPIAVVDGLDLLADQFGFGLTQRLEIEEAV